MGGDFQRSDPAEADCRPDGCSLLGVPSRCFGSFADLADTEDRCLQTATERMAWKSFHRFKCVMKVQADHLPAIWTQVGDQRITRVGFWLRRLRLDELPVAKRSQW